MPENRGSSSCLAAQPHQVAGCSQKLPDSDYRKHIAGAPNNGLFAVEAVNVGAGGLITASADAGKIALPQVALSICQTNPITQVCIGSFAPSITLQAMGATRRPLRSSSARWGHCPSTRATTGSSCASKTKTALTAARPASRLPPIEPACPPTSAWSSASWPQGEARRLHSGKCNRPPLSDSQQQCA
jgi:hypothetical protein